MIIQFIPVNCPVCGAPLSRDEVRETKNCQFCGAEIISHEEYKDSSYSDYEISVRENDGKIIEKRIYSYKKPALFDRLSSIGDQISAFFMEFDPVYTKEESYKKING